MQQTIYKFSLVNGQMAVQQEGVYYVFAQVFFENYPEASSIYDNRVELTVNGVRVALMQTPIGNQADYGTESSGAVVKVNTGGPHRLEDYVRKFHLVNRRSYLLWRL